MIAKKKKSSVEFGYRKLNFNQPTMSEITVQNLEFDLRYPNCERKHIFIPLFVNSILLLIRYASV